MSSVFLQDERLVDLLVKQTTEGLAPSEKAELDRLMTRHRDADPELIERVAAALALAGKLDDEPMPADLRRRVEAEGRKWVSASASPVTDIRTRRRSDQPLPTSRMQWVWFAAAASLLVAVLGWWPRLRDTLAPEPSVPVVTTEKPTVTPVPTPAEKRETLLAKGVTVVQSPWSSTADPASQGVAGDVVWDNESQTGYLRFSGLAANDPKAFQYQLWIFDATQDERYPIDGGVFDIPPGQTEVVIPIDPKIAVNTPMMFAVTMEKPGGVVVSGREHIVALAKVAAG
ncbi:MAG: anti-sigma factor [Gemmatimonadetes bacterium]|nr:anti-sigma factor [Gemmatimonadota bacterium]